jgi:hypothetical protein
MADSVHIGSFCAQASRRGWFGRLGIADVNTVTIRRHVIAYQGLLLVGH